MTDKTSLLKLQQDIGTRMSKKRYIHTVGVMEMASKIASYCLPDKKEELCCAALLHDVAKELSNDELIDIIKHSRTDFEKIIKYGPEVWHSFAAPYVINRDFPSFSTENILSSVEKHTVGAKEMTVFDEIIFISDYVEQGRIYPSCIAVRDYLLSAFEEGKIEDNINALHTACVMAIDYTVENLAKRGKDICPESLLAKITLQGKIK